jgi:hypothetical protein
MGQARFIARDPDDHTRATLAPLIADLHAVTRWEVEPDGQVWIEYDEQAGSVAVIEEALAGLGFEIEHLTDNPDAGNVTGQTATTRGGHDDNVSFRQAPDS